MVQVGARASASCFTRLFKPWALMFAEELSSKLDRTITLNFDRLFAADLSGRARAFSQWWAAVWTSRKQLHSLA